MKCMACHGNHKFAFQSLECHQREAARLNREAAQYRKTPTQLRAPTDAQLKYISDLSYKKGMRNIKMPQTFSQASRTIDYLKAQRDMANPEKPGPVIHFVTANLIKNGRYAVKVSDDFDQYVFVRVARPTTGRFKGTLRIQTQHGDDLVQRLLFSLKDGKTLYQHNRLIAGQSLAEVLSMILVEPQEAAFNYAQQKNVCFRCGKQLTDRRSAYFGIGPECEKAWPAYIEYVEDRKGAFV